MYRTRKPLAQVPGGILLKLQRDGEAFLASPRNSRLSPRIHSSAKAAVGWLLVVGGSAVATLALVFAITED